MRFLLVFICLSLLVSCQGDSEINDEVTGTVMEFEPSQLELDEIALDEQPQTVQDFFAVDNGLIGEDFCYNYSSISQLILFGNDTTEEWKMFEVSDNYLTAYHKECGVLLEFMTFELAGEKKAFLSQMTKNNQQFDYLKWNSKTERWNKMNRYPRPEMSDYFNILDSEGAELVNEYGSDIIYINPKSKSVTYEFSERAMLLSMGEKQQLEFNEKPDYRYELETTEDQLTLTRIPVYKEKLLNQSFLIAYGNLDNPPKALLKNSETIIAELSIDNLQFELVNYDAISNETTNFKVALASDTLDLSAIEQVNPEGGYWFYEKGKAPLVISHYESLEIIIQRAKAYFEADAE
ncbi:MAG: hypothetical protein GQ574_01100 [Crocinitomix sp.]|nr:hypothetical protein [Crocinitomix sp.]